MSATLHPAAAYNVHPDAMESRLGDETVILHLGSGTYFGLDAVGTIVWEKLQTGATPVAVCAHVRATFDDAPASVEADITAFPTQLLDAALIQPA